MFLSAVWTLILTAPIHCRGSVGEQVMLNLFQSVRWRNKLINILDGLRYIFKKCIFWVTYSFKYNLTTNTKQLDIKIKNEISWSYYCSSACMLNANILQCHAWCLCKTRKSKTIKTITPPESAKLLFSLVKQHRLLHFCILSIFLSI